VQASVLNPPAGIASRGFPSAARLGAGRIA